jgi:hypothetical protein
MDTSVIYLEVPVIFFMACLIIAASQNIAQTRHYFQVRLIIIIKPYNQYVIE